MAMTDDEFENALKRCRPQFADEVQRRLGVPPWRRRRLRLDRRGMLLCQLKSDRYPGQSDRKAAARLASDMLRLGASAFTLLSCTDEPNRARLALVVQLDGGLMGAEAIRAVLKGRPSPISG